MIEEYTTERRPHIETQMEVAGKEIEELMDDFPCLSEVCRGLETAAFPAALFTSACFMGTLMTRCTYRFYHRPEELRRLNYGVYIIGDPGSGKSFAAHLYKVLTEPLERESKKGMNAVNRYKRKYQQWENSGKKGDGPKKPKALIRIHPARTSNKVFIEDMCNAVDVVNGEEMHLHLLSFDTELDNTTRNQSQAWNNKLYMELKAFHNETDGECFVNSQLLPSFRVYWNYVYTGTPLALRNRVNTANIGNGLATRLATIPMPATHFRMIKREYLDEQATEPEEDKTLRMWAERLNKTQGELPIWKLVEECYGWTERRMEDAKDDQSKTEELLCKRVAYYGINVSVPFIVMRHWKEWERYGTLSIDEKDIQLCMLVCNIQLTCQRHFFAHYWDDYFRSMHDAQSNERLRKYHSTKLKERYHRLPNSFTVKDVEEICFIKKRNAEKMVQRWREAGYIEMVTHGHYEKIYNELN